MFSKFQCWRCDKVTSEGKKCSACGMAYYCTDRCRINDEFRHSTSECKDVVVRYICHGCKKKTEEQMKMCTNCMKVWFCSGECMKRSWKRHKIECKAISEATMELRMKLSEMDKLNKMCMAFRSQLYFWGNTPALDLLNLSMNEGLEYSQPLSLLLCGVGDPRNVCLTISKLQDTEHQGKVTFVMNDICACTLARTVLLLYLLWKGGESKAKSVTQIWYSLYLSEEDHVFVVECLRDLIQISNLEALLTRGIMKMEPAQLNELKNVWKTWLRLSREENAISWQRSQLFESNQQATFGIMSYIKEMPKKHQTSANDWLKNGVLSSERCRKDLVKENFTLLGLDSNTGSYKYAIRSDSLPFNCWDYRSVSAAYPDTDSLNEMYNDYITDVLRKTAARLNRDEIQLSFILCNCTDITPYLPEGITFDRITTSNLCDYVHLRELLQLTKPLLNSSNNLAVIITESQNWVNQFPKISLKKLGRSFLLPGSALRMKVLQDTGDKAIAESNGEQAFVDYYSLVEEFISFLRASFLNTSKYSGLKSTSLLPSVNQLAAELGLKPRDFTFRENKVAPFRWRLNTRRVTLLRASELSVEWTLL